MPERTCLGCRVKREKDELLRFVARDGKLRYDPGHILSGRGVYLCARKSCIDEAYKRKESFSRALKRKVLLPEKLELLSLLKEAI